MAASAGGAILADATQGVAALRPARKPLHPRGEVLDGRLYRHGSDETTGVAWLDEPGEDDAVVRRSRALGLPRSLPDIHGLAVRVRAGKGDDGDILFATTGLGRVTRFFLTAARSPSSRPMTTLLPYDTDAGALLLAADGGPERYELSWARASGEWHHFGVLLLSRRTEESEISFDPLMHQIEGLRQYPSVRRLRSPAYVRARRSRADTDTDTTTEENHHVH
ncbi:hypothetical protein ASC77_25125 [Nocardioides sp. Root1257]|uniref:hypothetical protein n=1 Tax=Nocardioides sp. Root1257 TaxID=1736439 RepID=UPI0006FE414A|nr:hypothetical protein [Nocardioides sp. Root1257]KQW50944.1 hypothetical protein ASC77_25125 [Nocardioides sp. Root1257]KRC53740.1 hypothetical protein ASE24_24915 [Nocardioides sp. Root224]